MNGMVKNHALFNLSSMLLCGYYQEIQMDQSYHAIDPIWKIKAILQLRCCLFTSQDNQNPTLNEMDDQNLG